MRIAFDISAYEQGSFGIGTYIKNLILAIMTLEPENNYILTSFPGFSWKLRANNVFQMPGIRFFRFPYVPRNVLNKLWNKYKLFPLDAAIGQFDVYHGLSFDIPHVRYARTVLTVHDVAWLFFPEENNKSLRFINRWLPSNLESADRIIAVSQSTKNDLIHYFNVQPEKISVIYEAGNPQLSFPVEESYCKKVIKKYRINSPYILSVGNLEPRKNISTLLIGFSRFQKKYSEYSLVLVGNKDADYGRLQSLANDLNILNKVNFTGYVSNSELGVLYKGASLFVYPSLYEGFGLPLLEAMSCSTPVIASNTPSLIEIGADGAHYFDPLDPEALTETMLKLIEDHDLSSNMREKGLERNKLFSWENSATKTLSIYSSLFNN